MQLLTIADLQRPKEQVAPLVQHARNLGAWLLDFIKNDNETHTYEVTDFGEQTREVGVHASEMSGCFRKFVYAVWGFERRSDPSTVNVNMKMRFRLGTAIHAMLQSDFTRMAIKSQGQLYFQCELQIHPDLQELAKKFNIYSHCDGVFTFSYWNGQAWVPYLRVGLELKSQSDGQFDKTKEPEEAHKDQSCLYQACLDVPLMWVLYYNKSNSNITNPEAPWLQRFDPKRWENLEKRIYSAYEHAHAGKLPAREEGMPCGWCPFSWHCQPAYLKRGTHQRTPLVNPSMLVRR